MSEDENADENENFLHAVEDAEEMDETEVAGAVASHQQPPQQQQVTVDQILASLGGKTVELDLLRGSYQQALAYVQQLENENKSLRKEIKRFSKGQRRV